MCRALPRLRHQLHISFMKLLISFGEANTTDARSPIIPEPVMTGLPAVGPYSLESVLSRRLNSQILCVLPLPVC